MSPLSGAFLVNKPVGLTSSDVVVRLKIALTRNGYAEKGFKIGHGGTLDPFAQGVLVVLVGEATKLADTYLHSKKAYRGIIQLGVQMDSADVTGAEVARAIVPALSALEWQKHADFFTEHDYLQIPPMHSAKKHQGRPLHELARAGIEIEREAILKKIFLFQVTPTGGESRLRFEIECESGTYVRVIAEDLAKRADTLAHLVTLDRSRSSDVQLEACSSLETLIEILEKRLELAAIPFFRPLSVLATHVSSIPASAETAKLLRHGQVQICQEVCTQAQKTFPNQRYVLVKNEWGPIALLEKGPDAAFFRVQRVFNP